MTRRYHDGFGLRQAKRAKDRDKEKKKTLEENEAKRSEESVKRKQLSKARHGAKELREEGTEGDQTQGLGKLDVAGR